MKFIPMIDRSINTNKREAVFTTIIKAIKDQKGITKATGKIVVSDAFLYKIDQDGLSIQGSKNIHDVGKPVNMVLEFDAVKSPFEIFKQIPKIKKIQLQLYKMAEQKITRLHQQNTILIEDISLAVGPRLREEIFEEMYDNTIYKKDRIAANATAAMNLGKRSKTLSKIWSLIYMLSETKKSDARVDSKGNVIAKIDQADGLIDRISNAVLNKTQYVDYQAEEIKNQELADLEGDIEFDLSNIVNPIIRTMDPHDRRDIENDFMKAGRTVTLQSNAFKEGEITNKQTAMGDTRSVAESDFALSAARGIHDVIGKVFKLGQDELLYGPDDFNKLVYEKYNQLTLQDKVTFTKKENSLFLYYIF